MDGDGGRKEMGRGRFEILVDNARRTHDGRRGGEAEGCYDTYRAVYEYVCMPTMRYPVK